MSKEDLTGRSRLIRNVGASYVSHFVFMAFGFIMPRLIDGYAGQTALGVWDFGWAFVSYLGLAMLGIPSKPMETDWGAIILKALTIKGVYGREMFTTWRKMLGLLKAGLDLTPLITHRLPFTDFEQGFEAMKSGKSGKVVLDWDKAA